MKQKLNFTIYHGLIASLLLHGSLSLPFVIHGLASPDDAPPTLVVELQGAVADTQIEQKELEQTKGQTAQDDASAAKAAEAATAAKPQPAEPVADQAETPAPVPVPKPAQAPSPPEAETKTANPGAQNIVGTEVRQTAQRIKPDQTVEIDQLRAYAMLLSKKVQANLIYPREARSSGLQGNAKVSFTILSNGQIGPDSLKVVTSSGQALLDASALQTIRASAPFAPPPKEMTIAIAVAFGRKP